MRGIYIVSYAAILHITWGFVLLFSSDVLATPIAPFFYVFGNASTVGFICLIVSLLALVGNVRWKETFPAMFCLLPQQFLLMLSAYASAMSVWNSAYADGVIRDRAFIFCDQFPNILAVLLHSFYMLELMVKILCEKTELKS